MKQKVSLFINNKEVEFNKDPMILFNYKVTDATNPTVVKNSFSKTITIEGTPSNNALFENIWNLERIQYVGISFDPIRKAPFTIYVNGDIYESGYAKLDAVNTKNNNIEYEITLFGGLGEFFYSLAYKSTEGDDKKQLSDLDFAEREWMTGTYASEEYDLNFKINKNAIFDAWCTINGDPDAVYSESEARRPDNYLYDDKWEIINFAPTYDGIPDDFDANKTLINKRNMPIFDWTVEDGGSTYTDYDGFALGESTSSDLTPYETFDLRSYLMRPVVSFKHILGAIGNPKNNGGYEVDFDESFFNTKNPYFDSAWMTLPMLRENIEGGETVTSAQASLQYQSGALPGESVKAAHYKIAYQEPESLTKKENLRMGLTISAKIPTNLANNRLYFYHTYNGSISSKGETQRVEEMDYIGSVYVQLIAFDALNNVVGTSNVYFCVEDGAPTEFGEQTPFYTNYYVPGTQKVTGRFTKTAAQTYTFTNSKGEPIVLGFSFAAANPFTRLELMVQPAGYYYWYYRNPYKWYQSKYKNGYFTLEEHLETPRLYTLESMTYNGDRTIDQVRALGGYNADFQYSIVDFELIGKDYSEFFSHTYVTKEQLLKSEHSPCDYLISYAKMFGLYFYRDPAEEASDPARAPKGVIHIMTRDTFYNDEIKDISKIVDMNKGIKMIPQTADAKYYNFDIEQVDSEAAAEYEAKYNAVYGGQKINTGYNFNNENKSLLDKVVFKGGVDVLETSKYYVRPVQWYPIYCSNGFKYSLFKITESGLESKEIEVPVEQISEEHKLSINPNGWKNTDAFAKMQFHSEDNSPEDGANVLCFYVDDSYNTGAEYWITDDLEEMNLMNDGTPCYIMTADEFDIYGQRVAYKTRQLPIFNRSLIYPGNNTIKHTWEMGHPQMTFVRDTFIGDRSGIYSKCWKNFMTDMYSVDSRILTTYCYLKERPNSEVLRSFYWFNNSIWRINSIKDWKIGSYDPAIIEFVKVIDTENYKLIPITESVTATFTFTNITNIDDEYTDLPQRTHYYRIGYEAKDCIGVIDIGNAGSWYMGGDEPEFWVNNADGTYQIYSYADYIEPSDVRGTGNATKIFHIWENPLNMERTFDFTVMDGNDQYYSCYVIQEANPNDPETPDDVDPDFVPGFDLDPESLNFTAGGGIQEVRLTNYKIDNHTIGTLPFWLSLYGSEDTYFELQASPNTGAFARVGNVQITGITDGYDDVVKTLSVRQDKTNSTASFGSTVLTLGSNAGATASTTVTMVNVKNWLYLAEPSDYFQVTVAGDGSSVTVKARTQNNTGNPITGTLTGTFTDNDGNRFIRTLTIVQNSY